MLVRPGLRLISEFLRYGCARSFEDIFESLTCPQGGERGVDSDDDDSDSTSRRIIATLVRDFEAEIDDSVRLLESL